MAHYAGDVLPGSVTFTSDVTGFTATFELSRNTQQVLTAPIALSSGTAGTFQVSSAATTNLIGQYQYWVYVTSPSGQRTCTEQGLIEFIKGPP